MQVVSNRVLPSTPRQLSGPAHHKHLEQIGGSWDGSLKRACVTVAVRVGGAGEWAKANAHAHANANSQHLTAEQRLKHAESLWGLQRRCSVQFGMHNRTLHEHAGEVWSTPYHVRP